MKFSTTTVLAASLSGAASAGVLTMTASSTTGSDGWASLLGYTMVMTIDCSTIDDAGSSSSFVLNSWSFKAMDSSSVIKFEAKGSAKTFSVAPNFGMGVVTFELNSSNTVTNNMVPAAEAFTFVYAFSANESLRAAIEASAGTAAGILQLGTGIVPTGTLAGRYAVPAPGAAALLVLAGVMSRRRKA
ncbi:MAG: hypothetical protein FJ292_00380 [Planctomycetes bacterium]|nr:hypothetical protein [Planctomycetota bacterium]